MPAITHANPIVDQTAIVKYVGAAVAVIAAVFATIAIVRSSDLTASIPTPQTAVSVAQPSASTALEVTGLAQPLSINTIATPTVSTTQPDVVSILQPAVSPIMMPVVSVSDLQSAGNTIQVTGNSLQNAAVVLQ